MPKGRGFRSVNFDESFAYMLLSRLNRDCRYYLSYGNRNPKYLWAGEEREHIALMKALWSVLPIDAKPEWLDFKEILNLEKNICI